MKNIQQLQDDGFSAARVGIFLGFGVWCLGFRAWDRPFCKKMK